MPSTDAERRTSPMAPFAIFALAILLVVAAHWATIPGVDLDELIRVLAPHGPALRRTLAAFQTREMVSPIVSAISTLVLVRLTVALVSGSVRLSRTAPRVDSPYAPPVESRDARQRRARMAGRIGGAVYLLLVAASGLAIAMYVAELHGSDPIIEIVPNATWGFRVGAIALYVACASVVWMVSNAITRTRIVHGPIAFAAALGVVHGVSELLEAGASAAEAEIWPRAALVPLVSSIPFALLCLFVSRRPQRVRKDGATGLRAFSSYDLVLAPAAIGLLVPTAAQLARLFLRSVPSMTVASNVVIVVELAAALALGIAVVRGRRRSRASAAWALAAPLVVVAAFATIVVGVVAAHGKAGDFVLRGLIHGGWRYRVLLGTNEGDANADIGELRRRFAGANLEVTVGDTRRDEVAIELRSRRPLSARTIERLLTPSHLEIAWVGNGGRPLDPTTMPGGPTPDAVREQTAGFVFGAQLRVAIECTAVDRDATGGDATPCRPWLLEVPALLTNADIAAAETMLRADTGEPYVALTLRDEAARRFGEETTGGVGRLLAIVIDDQILIRTVVNEPIRNGRVSISMSRGSEYDDAMEVSAMFGGELHARWFVGRVTSID